MRSIYHNICVITVFQFSYVFLNSLLSLPQLFRLVIVAWKRTLVHLNSEPCVFSSAFNKEE